MFRSATTTRTASPSTEHTVFKNIMMLSRAEPKHRLPSLCAKQACGPIHFSRLKARSGARG